MYISHSLEIYVLNPFFGNFYALSVSINSALNVAVGSWTSAINKRYGKLFTSSLLANTFFSWANQNSEAFFFLDYDVKKPINLYIFRNGNIKIGQTVVVGDK